MIRRLGSGELADVYLGVASVPDQDVTRAPVALKIFRRETPGPAIEREFRVLTDTTAGRFPALIDVATLIDGRVCFVMEHRPGIRLSRWLSQGSLVAPGEAVTILAPVAAALAELAALGSLHGGPSQSTVRLDVRGRPVLTGLGRLRELPPPGPARSRATEEAAERFAAFALGVLDRVNHPGVGSVGPTPGVWLASVTTGMPFHSLLDEFEHRLFNWAPAEAVQLEHRVPHFALGDNWDASGKVRGLLMRGGVVGVAGPSGLGGDHGRRSSRAERRGRGVVPGDAGNVGTHPVEFRRGRGRRLRPLLDVRLAARVLDRFHGGLRVHRGPLLVSGLVAVAVAVLLLTLLYSPDSGRVSTDAVGVQSTPSAFVARPTTGYSARPPTPGVTPSADGSEGDRADLEGDEPVRAVQVLLRQRAGCLVTASIACLDGVDQAGSVALATDAESVRASQQSGSGPFPSINATGPAPALLERSGDVALVAVVELGGLPPGNSKPASVLVVKGEAGWRIRQVFDY
jgi:hypothetical protein